MIDGSNFWCICSFIACNYEIINEILHAVSAFQVLISLAILFALGSTCARIQYNLLYMYDVLLVFSLTLTLVIDQFLSRVAFSIIKFKSTLTWEIFYCLGFIYSFYQIKYFQVWIFTSITTPITPAVIKNEWILKTFIKIQIHKRWCDHALLSTHGYTVYRPRSCLSSS